MIRYVNRERKRTLEVTENEIENYLRTVYKELRKMGENYDQFNQQEPRHRQI